MLAYLSDAAPVVVRDDGRKIYHQISWRVRGLAPTDDVTVVVRHDHTVSAAYLLEVNGQTPPLRLDFPRLPEQWGEIGVVVPAELLREGENRFRLTRDRSVAAEAEVYHMWFLQRSDPASR